MAFQLKLTEYRAAKQTTTARLPTITKIEKRLIPWDDRRALKSCRSLPRRSTHRHWPDSVEVAVIVGAGRGTLARPPERNRAKRPT
jgi:hypothetical protein